MGQGLKSQLRWFSRKTEVDSGAFVRGDRIFYKDAQGEREMMPLADMQLKGAHNVENVLAAVAIGMIVGVAPEKIREAVKNFKAVEHRLEYVATINGVEFYNDSKATNVDATIKALESFPRNIHIILGGKDKGSDYTVLKPLLQDAGQARVYDRRSGGEDRVAHREALQRSPRPEPLKSRYARRWKRPRLATWSYWPRRVRASISSPVMSIVEGCSRNW